MKLRNGDMGYKNNSKREIRKEVAASEIPLGQYGGRRDNETLDSIQEVVKS